MRARLASYRRGDPPSARSVRQKKKQPCHRRYSAGYASVGHCGRRAVGALASASAQFDRVPANAALTCYLEMDAVGLTQGYARGFPAICTNVHGAM